MKKTLIRIGIGLVILLVVVVLAASLFLNGAVKKAIETVGPRLTQVTVKLDKASVSVLSGSGSIQGLVVGNPEGYKTPQAISVGSASLALKPTSILSDKLVIRSINLQSPEITFEGGFGGNNLKKILDNVDEATGGTSTNAAPETTAKSSRKLEVDDFVISKAKLNVSVTGMGGKSIPVTLPDIHLTQLGTGPDGITAAELTKLVLQKVEKVAVKAADGAMANLGKNATDAAKNIQQNLEKNAGEKIGKGIGDLFKKK